MSTIAELISGLTTARNNIRTALVEKGITGAASHGFADFEADIWAITGGGSSEEAIPIPDDKLVYWVMKTGSSSSATITKTVDIPVPLAMLDKYKVYIGATTHFDGVQVGYKTSSTQSGYNYVRRKACVKLTYKDSSNTTHTQSIPITSSGVLLHLDPEVGTVVSISVGDYEAMSSSEAGSCATITSFSYGSGTGTIGAGYSATIHYEKVA